VLCQQNFKTCPRAPSVRKLTDCGRGYSLCPLPRAVDDKTSVTLLPQLLCTILSCPRAPSVRKLTDCGRGYSLCPLPRAVEGKQDLQPTTSQLLQYSIKTLDPSLRWDDRKVYAKQFVVRLSAEGSRELVLNLVERLYLRQGWVKNFQKKRSDSVLEPVCC